MPLTENFDVALLITYLFWLFFFGVVFFIRREDRREGYPLESEGGRIYPSGPILMPKPKTFKRPDGSTYSVPNKDRDAKDVAARRTARWPGAPLEPTGDPMVDGIGPAAFCEREDEPERMREGEPLIVPMRVATDFSIARFSRDPRGLKVLGADKEQAGTVKDVWVDRADQIIRYLEVEISSERTVLLPMTMAKITGQPRLVRVQAIKAGHFASVPSIANPDQVTLMEEERICAYFTGGYMYADKSREEPFI